MVMIKRRHGQSTTPRELQMGDNNSSSSSLPYGDFRDSPKYHQQAGGTFNAEQKLKEFKNSLNKPTYLPSWAIKCLVGFIVVSWCVAIYWHQQVKAEIKIMEKQYEVEALHFEEATETLKEATKTQKTLERYVQKLETTKKALEHEVRMAEEMEEDESIGGHHHHEIVKDIENRHKVLQEKIESLRNYIKEESHREVLEK